MNWLHKIFRVNDSSGRESRTLMFVTASWFVLWLKFLAAGLTLPVIGLIPSMTATEFGLTFAAILAPWLGREMIKK